jgi:hypothetical protein
MESIAQEKPDDLPSLMSDASRKKAALASVVIEVAFHCLSLLSGVSVTEIKCYRMGVRISMGRVEKGVLRVVKQVVVPAVDLNARRCMTLISYGKINAPLVIVFAE